MKEETWQELDDKALTAIQLCLADEVLDEFSMEKTTSSLWKRLKDHYLKKSLANQLILKQRLFLFRMHVHLSSLTLQNFSLLLMI